MRCVCVCNFFLLCSNSNPCHRNLIPFFQHEMSENERTMMIQNRKIELGTFSYHTGDVGSVNSNGALVIDPDHLLFVVKIPFLVPQDSVLLSDLNGVLHEMEKRITDGFSVMFGSHPPGHYKIKEDVLNGLDSTHFFIAEKATSLKKNNEHKMEVLIDVNMILHESQYTKLG